MLTQIFVSFIHMNRYYEYLYRSQLQSVEVGDERLQRITSFFHREI